MTIIYRKHRHPHLISAGRAAARGETSTFNCPTCGSVSKMVEKYKDRATYKCNACGELSTFTINPGDVKKLHKTQKNPTGILVRDRSKENKTKNIETKPQEKVEGNIKENLNNIREGMKKRSNLMFEYIGKNGDKTLRDVEPYKLIVSKKGELILYAYCTVGKGIRTFKLNNIKGVEVSQTEFKPRWVLEDKIKDDDRRD